MSKTEKAGQLTDKNFIDWEANVFGFGYGTGEAVIIPALRRFCEILQDGHSYDYRLLEQEFGALSAWLLINALAHGNLIEYGTSPRFGWLTVKGGLLRGYLLSKSVQELVDVITERDCESAPCFPDCCQCGAGERRCNPLFAGYRTGD